ncbi:MAG TPA: tetratricopeptide repeat protein [Anaerolineales bacterium]|nr:tetratricopeptide repeat protein [Anaerolineales bacterium]
MSRKLEQLDTSKARKQLREISRELIEGFGNKKSVLANAFGIKGMGKDHLLALLADKLDSRSILHPKIINIPESPTSSEVLDVSKQIADWVYSNILISKEKASRDMDGLEKDYFSLRGKLKDKPSFAVLVNDIHNLPFDDLDWFQSVVLEALVSSPGSMVVVTSQNELNWHSWEMRNKCTSVPLPVFSPEEILELCESQPLAQKIEELSAGHPKTVQALVGAAGKKGALSSITEEDVVALDKEFCTILKDEIDDSLSLNDKNGWLGEVFYLVSAADGFDADLVSDIVSVFNISTPEDITDIAWEMAYTGLAYWDFDKKTYKIVPELRDRIVKYMEHERKDDRSKALETIANSYLLRAEILPDWANQTVRFINYFISSKRLQGVSPKAIVREINERIDKLLKTTEDYAQLSTSIHQDKSEDSLLKEILYSFEGSSLETVLQQENRGDAMRDIHPPKLEIEKPSMSRQEIQDYLKKFVTGEVKGKWVFHIQAEGGMGKTHLLSTLRAFLKSENLVFAQIDLHIPEIRNVHSILSQIADQTGVNKVKEVADAFANLKREMKQRSEEKSPKFSAESSKEQFDRPYISVIDSLREAFVKFAVRPVVLIDTLDEGAKGLTKWLLPKLMSEFRNVSYFVVAGRLHVTEYAKPEWNLGVFSVELGSLNREEIQHIVDNGLPGELPIELSDEIVNGIANISRGNPLVVLWILLYLKKFEKEEDWLKLIESLPTQDQIFEHIAEKIWTDPRLEIVSTDRETKTNEDARKARMVALRAAAHFGSHFNFDLFNKAVSSSELKGITHQTAYDALRKEFIFIRGVEGHAHWTLHDRVREWLLGFIQRQSQKDAYPLSEKYSKNALDNYYTNLIEELEKDSNRSAEKQDRLDALKAEAFYHRLLVNTQPGDKPQQHHRDLWNYLDDLWDHYRHDQMAQVLRFVEELRNWEFIKKDWLLQDIRNAAQAWLSYSQTDYDEARKHASKVRKLNNPHRRLQATANVVLGLLPAVNPDEAFDYLNRARHDYEELIGELEKGRHSSDEFTDSLERIYPELHLVLLSLGRTHLRYFVDLDKGVEALQEAYKNSRKPQWKKPLYSAVALNEWARILRFQGDYSEALNKVMIAILIYKKVRTNPKNLVNFGYFYETLGLIYKELSEYDQALNAFDEAQDIYKNIPGILETRKATITLEVGEVYVLKKQPEKAVEPLTEAYYIFKKDVNKTPYYYLSALNKLGRYYRSINQADNARKYFIEQNIVSQQYNHHLWQYWAELSLAEIDYEQGKTDFDEGRLISLLVEYSSKRFEFGPPFWRTKKLLYEIAKERDKDISSAVTHLTQGLTYLAKHWRALFWQNLVILRNELLDMDISSFEVELNRVVTIWKNELPEGEPTHPFLQVCESLRESLK